MVLAKSLLFPRLTKVSILARSLHQSNPLREGDLGDLKWSWERNAGREVVGHGKDGDEGSYADRYDFWYPGIRFRKEDDVIKAVRVKEKGDWKNLSIEDKKLLYRYSFRQTLAEFDAHRPYWKLTGFYTFVGIIFTLAYSIYTDLIATVGSSPTFDPEWVDATTEKELYEDIGYFNSGAPYYDFENNKWKV